MVVAEARRRERHGVRVTCRRRRVHRGRVYTADVESNYGVGGAATLCVGDPMEDVVLDLSRSSAEVKARVFPLLPASGHWSRALSMEPQHLEIHHNRQLVASTPLSWARGVSDLHVLLSRLTPIFMGHTYTLKVPESSTVEPLAISLVGEQASQLVDVPLRRRSYAAHVTLKSKDELPLPPGIRVQIRHRATAALVAARKTGEAEAQRFEAAAAQAAKGSQQLARSEGDVQAAEALKRVREFMRDNEIFFNGAGDDGLPSAEQAWSINHLDARYKAQNHKTIDGIVSILRDYDQVALEVHGETGHADHAPENLADFFGLDRSRDVQRIMERLAEARADAVRQALVLRGVAPERLLVTFNGRGGHIRTDFIPRSMHDSSRSRAPVTKQLAPHSAPGRLVFASASDAACVGLAGWAVEHADPAFRMQNRATLEAVAGTMLRYPMLHLEVAVTAQSQYVGDAPRRLLAHFPGATDARLDGEIPRVFFKYDANRSGDVDADELRAALAELGLDASTEQAAAVLAKYDKDRSGALELDEFAKLVRELRTFQRERLAASGGGASALAPSAARSWRRTPPSTSSPRARVSALLSALSQLGVPTERSFGVVVVGGASDAVSFTARTAAWREQAASSEDGGGVGGGGGGAALGGLSRAGGARRVLVGGGVGHVAPSQLTLHRATSATVQIDTPDALYPNESYLLETVAMPSLGVAHQAVEFVMPARDERLTLELERPTATSASSSSTRSARRRTGRRRCRCRRARRSACATRRSAWYSPRRPPRRERRRRNRDGRARRAVGLPPVRHQSVGRHRRAGAAPRAARPRPRDRLVAGGGRPRQVRHRPIGRARVRRVRHPRQGAPLVPLRAPPGRARRRRRRVPRGGRERHGGRARDGGGAARYALRDRLFVGERYTLEVVESDELEPTSLEFTVEYADQQAVEVYVTRKSRDVSVVLRYLEDDLETVPLDVKAEAITVKRAQAPSARSPPPASRGRARRACRARTRSTWA